MTLARFATSLPEQHVRLGRAALGGLVLSAALLTGLVLSISLPPLADEPHHIGQIRLLLQGRWELLPSLATLPGYHAIVAALAEFFGRADLPALRLYSFALSLAAVAAACALARRPQDGRGTERVLQFTFLPVLFPLLFLLYTDVAAVLFLCLTLLLQEKQRYGLAAAAGTCMLAVRQNYIVWFAFAALCLAISVVHDVASPRALLTRRGLVELARKGTGYAIGFALFFGMLVWNRGMAMGDRAMHPFPTIHFGNLYFALLLGFVFFLPLHVANARQVAKRARRPGNLFLLTALLVLFLATFKADHPYNQPELDWWLHNALLNVLISSVWTRLAMFAAMGFTVLSLSVTPLRAGFHQLLYPFAGLSLLPMWQIEPRYGLPAMTLFLLFRLQRGLALEWSLVAYLAALSGAAMWAVSSGTYFL